MEDERSVDLLMSKELGSIDVRTHSLIPLRGGRGGALYRANTSIGPLVLKLRSDAQPVEAEADAARLMANFGLDHQEVVLAPRSTALGWLIAQRWVDGCPLDVRVASRWSPVAAAQFGIGLGRWLKRFHAMPVAQFDWSTHADARLNTKLTASLERRCISPQMADAIRYQWTAARCHLDRAPTALIHRDLHRSNILRDGSRLAGVIDFEQSLFADPLYDLVKLMDYVLPIHPELAPAFFTEYRLDVHDPDVASRLWAVLVLDRLSSMPYFRDRSDERMVDYLRMRLEELIARPRQVPRAVLNPLTGD
jgi:aminoglycoside phosphotransferase